MKGDNRGRREQRIADTAAVVIAPGMPMDAALKQLKRRVERAGIPRELRRREHFESPSARRRSKAQRARKRAARAAERLLQAFTPPSEANEKPRTEDTEITLEAGASDGR
jgi:small subunit ribosomal protein S21